MVIYDEGETGEELEKEQEEEEYQQHQQHKTRNETITDLHLPLVLVDGVQEPIYVFIMSVAWRSVDYREGG